jgi:hypothetical protein
VMHSAASVAMAQNKGNRRPDRMATRHIHAPSLGSWLDAAPPYDRP